MAYPIVGGLSLGDSVEVVGKNTTGDWLQIAHPSGSDDQGWIAAAYADLTGSLAAVPEVSAPPPPPPPPMAAMESVPIEAQAAPPAPELTGKLVFQWQEGGLWSLAGPTGHLCH
jgi:hypothetical protein